MNKPKPRKRRVVKDTSPQVWPETMEQLVKEKLGWVKIYWVIGNMPSHSRNRNEVKDPPNAGWSSCFVLPAGGKRVRLFCPYTFNGYTVTKDSMEYASLEQPRDRMRRTWMREHLHRQWAKFEEFGFQRDYDTAARVMREMKWEVPVRVEPVVDLSAPEVKKRGKDAAPKLIKPVPRNGRRGEVLSWFMDSFEPRSIREAMAEFDTTRSNILTVLFQLNKEHGLGYRLAGDAAEIELPSKGCDKLFS